MYTGRVKRVNQADRNRVDWESDSQIPAAGINWTFTTKQTPNPTYIVGDLLDITYTGGGVVRTVNRVDGPNKYRVS